MLIELWERLRGYDKWVEIEAKVGASRERTIESVGRWGNRTSKLSDDVIIWVDKNGEKQNAGFTVDGDSRLFKLKSGNSITIRYNPSDPKMFYVRDLLYYKIRQFLAAAVVIAAAILVLAFSIWHHTPSANK